MLKEYSYINYNDELRNELENYKTLCTLYNKEFNIPVTQNDDKYEEKKVNPNLEIDFLNRLSDIDNEQALNTIYGELHILDSGILIQKLETWQILVDKTFEINGNINLLLNLFKKDYYPHSDYSTYNAKYYHFGLAAALKNINTRKDMIDYLSKNSGHGGFINIMKAYEVLRDKEMCVKLFERFLKFCHLLVD